METVQIPGKSVDSSDKYSQMFAVLRGGEHCKRDRSSPMLVFIGADVGQSVLEKVAQYRGGVLPAIGALLGGDLAG